MKCYHLIMEATNSKAPLIRALPLLAVLLVFATILFMVFTDESAEEVFGRIERGIQEAESALVLGRIDSNTGDSNLDGRGAIVFRSGSQSRFMLQWIDRTTGKAVLDQSMIADGKSITLARLGTKLPPRALSAYPHFDASLRSHLARVGIFFSANALLDVIPGKPGVFDPLIRCWNFRWVEPENDVRTMEYQIEIMREANRGTNEDNGQNQMKCRLTFDAQLKPIKRVLTYFDASTKKEQRLEEKYVVFWTNRRLGDDLFADPFSAPEGKNAEPR